MYKASKTFCLSFLVIGLLVFVLTIFTSPLLAIDLPFDPNDYTFLVYNPGGGEASIIDAMEDILGRQLDTQNEIRDRYNPVTPTDLATHDILIVGWNNWASTSGLHTDDLLAGITGRIVLTGHDLDFHTVSLQKYQAAAEEMLINTIDYVLQGNGTGLIALGCTNSFSYLPQTEWGIDASYHEGEIIQTFTAEGLDSGIFDGLDPNDMCNWIESYHNLLMIESSSAFMPFELGGSNGTDIITIARNSTYGLSLTKSDDLVDPNACVAPPEELVYTLTWTRVSNAIGDPNQIELIDYLPAEVTFDEEIGTSDGVYDWQTNTVFWNLGTIAAGSSGSRSFRVIVNEQAIPKGTITNRAYLTNYRLVQKYCNIFLDSSWEEYTMKSLWIIPIRPTRFVFEPSRQFAKEWRWRRWPRRTR